MDNSCIATSRSIEEGTVVFYGVDKNRLFFGICIQIMVVSLHSKIYIIEDERKVKTYLHYSHGKWTVGITEYKYVYIKPKEVMMDLVLYRSINTLKRNIEAHTEIIRPEKKRQIIEMSNEIIKLLI